MSNQLHEMDTKDDIQMMETVKPANEHLEFALPSQTSGLTRMQTARVHWKVSACVYKISHHPGHLVLLYVFLRSYIGRVPTNHTWYVQSMPSRLLMC